MNDSTNIRGLKVPMLLQQLVGNGRWGQLSSALLRSVLPSDMDPVVPLRTLEDMARASRSELAEHGKVFFIERSSVRGRAIELPWLDIDQAFFIAVNEIPGDDVAVALDYRLREDSPAVVASIYREGSSGTPWQEVASTFQEFAARLGLTGS
jgi:hypothetical protein